MKLRHLSPSVAFFMTAAVLAFTLNLTLFAHAETTRGIYGFPGYNFGSGGLVADSAGNLYGTTELGGTGTDGCNPNGCGTVFELSPTTRGWTGTTIYSFTGGTDGDSPLTGLALDTAGNLYGATSNTVYRLSPSSGGTWTETTLCTFSSYSYQPQGPLVLDSAGNIYGSTRYGGSISGTCGSSGCGLVYKLSPNADGSWTQTVLHTFSGGSDGANPGGALTLVGHTLYGATDGAQFASGCSGIGCGLVFQLAPTSTGWRETVLHLFTGGTDGLAPNGGLAVDSSGDLIGTAYKTIFKLSHSATGWRETTLHNFVSDTVGYAAGPVVLDAEGNIYGESNSAQCQSFISPCGVVYKVSDSNGEWKVSAHYRLGETAPSGDVLLDAAGDIFGIENGPSETGNSGVFEITP